MVRRLAGAAYSLYDIEGYLEVLPLVCCKIDLVRKQNREDLRSNLHGLMMMIVKNIPWNISAWNALFDEKKII